jgi:hypothetical protein
MQISKTSGVKKVGPVGPSLIDITLTPLSELGGGGGFLPQKIHFSTFYIPDNYTKHEPTTGLGTQLEWHFYD